MGSFKIVKGDLFTTTDNCIAHGCNNQGVMGAGVALEIKRRYPWAYKKYKEFGPVIPGTVISANQDGLTIFNMITQSDYGYGAKLVLYDAVDEAALKVDRILRGSFLPNISIPKIGAGLGGGHWPVIEEILKYRWYSWNVTVYEL